MSLSSAFLLALAIAFSAKTLAWVIQKRTRNAGLVDPIWAWTLAVLALVFAWIGTAPAEVRIALAVMGAAWGVRLGIHLWRRNAGKPEDWRYAKFRAEWGAGADAKMFWFFQFQNIFTLTLAGCAFLPVAFRTDMPHPVAFALAVLIWLISVIGEAVADAQLERFRTDSNNRGEVCRVGLWRYSRHPNYFFECVHWVAYIPLAFGSPLAVFTPLAPIVMAFLLMKLSGVPMLEAGLMHRKRGYADYVRTTSALIPWPPKPSARPDGEQQ
ncbi:MAG TPA: DUF1295 domain-containing protein [Burkholderiaceae bacterium]|nr:DUF1295 domain-containing protein [Burkholderiaceae bacterium]